MGTIAYPFLPGIVYWGFNIYEGIYAVLEISDTGSGIPPEIIDKIFEPYFTTKETGKGTGLGLSVVYGIIEDHNGYINVSSIPGHGTCFRILILDYQVFSGH